MAVPGYNWYEDEMRMQAPKCVFFMYTRSSVVRTSPRHAQYSTPKEAFRNLTRAFPLAAVTLRCPSHRFLIVAAVIVAVLCLGGICYLIVYYQHPEDRNQAWLSKIVIIIGLELVVMAVLMFPLDVGNRRSCSDQYFVSACKFAIPMKQLW